MVTLTLPFLDVGGTLTPHVIAAMEAGATSANNFDDPATFYLTFEDTESADAFSVAAGLQSPSQPENEGEGE